MKALLRGLCSLVLLCLSAIYSIAVGQSASTSGDCSPAFSHVDVKGDLTVVVDCAKYRPQIQGLADELNALKRANKIGSVQLSNAVSASNLMIKAVMRQVSALTSDAQSTKKSLKNLEIILTKEVAENTSANFPKVAADWVATYKDVTKDVRAEIGEDDADRQAALALAQLDFTKSKTILDELLARSNQDPKLIALRNYRRAEISRLEFQPMAAIPYYKKSYLLEPVNYQYARAYARVLNFQGNFSAAELVYIPLILDLRKNDPAAAGRMEQLADTLLGIGSIYQATQRFPEAERSYMESLAIMQKISSSDSSIGVAKIFNNLALLYGQTNRLTESEQFQRKSVEKFRDLVKEDSTNVDALLNALNSLGNILVSEEKFKEAESTYLEALNTSKKLYESNGIKFKYEYARALGSIGIFYAQTDESERALPYVIESEKLFKQMFSENPSAYSADYATIIQSLSQTYAALRKFDLAEAYGVDAIKLRKELIQREPEAYRYDLAQSYYSMMILYALKGQTKKAIKTGEETLVIFRDLSQSREATYRPAIGKLQSSLAAMYADDGNLTAATVAATESIKIFEELVRNNNRVYEVDLGHAIFNYGNILEAQNKYTDAADCMKKALDIFRVAYVNNGNIYKFEMTKTLNRLASVYKKLGRYQEAEALISQAKLLSGG
nr:tetratricopeptide repeat protein [uncultured Cupriavidus sp.]